MALKDKIILVIIFAFIIYIFIKNKDFIIFAIKLDIKKCYDEKRCRIPLSRIYKKN